MIPNTEPGAEEALLTTIPEHLQEGLRLYLSQGIEPGGFLCACIENNLVRAVLSGSPDSLFALPAIARWLHQYAYASSWGDRETRLAWQRRLSARRRLGGV